MPPTLRPPAARPRRVTIRDVATAASVSTATVSYVLNDTPGQTITEATRRRVREAAVALGYSPHGVARALREGQSRIVLLAVPSMRGGRGLESFVAGMSAELRTLDHSLLVTTSEDGLPREAIQAIAPRATLRLADFLAESAWRGPVLGAVDGRLAGLEFHTLTQLRHLAERGHRDIAFALPDHPDPIADQRVAHVEGAATSLGLGPVRVLRLEMGEDAHARRAAVRELAEATPVTAVATYSDDVALGVLGAMAALRLRAPDDLAVIGFDDGEAGRVSQPALTTVRIDAGGFGRRAARVALGLDPGEWVESPSKVIVRATT